VNNHRVICGRVEESCMGSLVRSGELISRPGVWVANGTGVAPFCGYVDELNAVSGDSAVDRLLFFGCRTPEPAEYFCKEQLERAVTTGKLSALVLAFSRDVGHNHFLEKTGFKLRCTSSADAEQNHTAVKTMYVQHRLWEMRDSVWDILVHKKGYLAICGLTKMSTEVLSMLNLILELKKGDPIEDTSMFPSRSTFQDYLMTSSSLYTEVWETD